MSNFSNVTFLSSNYSNYNHTSESNDRTGTIFTSDLTIIACLGTFSYVILIYIFVGFSLIYEKEKIQCRKEKVSKQLITKVIDFSSLYKY